MLKTFDQFSVVYFPRADLHLPTRVFAEVGSSGRQRYRIYSMVPPYSSLYGLVKTWHMSEALILFLKKYPGYHTKSRPNGRPDEDNPGDCSGHACIHRWSHEQDHRMDKSFKRHQQQVGESISNYLITLRKLLKTCKFCLDACAH